MMGNTLLIGPHWLGEVPKKMAILFKDNVETPLCYHNSSISFHTWVSKNLSRSNPSSEVRNNAVKWSDWFDKLSPRYEKN